MNHTSLKSLNRLADRSGVARGTHLVSPLVLAASLGTGGCALKAQPPTAGQMAALPVVQFPATPPRGDFILKLARGQSIPIHLIVKGSLLTAAVDQTVSTAIVDDLYLHKQWASWDGKTWQLATDLVGVDLRLALPSDAHPLPAEIAMQVDRKDQRP